MGPEQNGELLRYYATRKVWLLLADRKPSELIAYPGAQTASHAAELLLKNN
jgi:hypothetical protein